jgi:hypothetical protein
MDTNAINSFFKVIVDIEDHNETYIHTNPT